MKPVFLLLVVLFGAMGFNALYAQTYVPFPEVACWHYEASVAVEMDEYTTIIIEDDTLIDGNIYHKLYGYINGYEGSCCPLGWWQWSCIHHAYLGAFREDSSKNIWFRSNLAAYYNNMECTHYYRNFSVTNNDSTDILLYKFDLAIGDTLPIYNRVTTQPYIVEAIDSVNMVNTYPPSTFDTYRKRYKIKNVQSHIYWGTGIGNDIDYWVEGIGSLIHFFQPILIGSPTPVAVPNSTADYYDRTGMQFMEDMVDCSIFTNAPTLSTTNSLLANPNPFNQQLSLTYSGDLQTNVLLSVINLQGSIVAQQKFGSTNHFTHTFDLQHLPAGIYFVSLQTNKGVWVQKVVKNNG